MELKDIERVMVRNHSAGENWFQLLYGLRNIDASGSVTHLSYKLVHGSGIEVCEPVMGYVYGAPANSWKLYAAAVKGGSHCWRDHSGMDSRVVRQGETKAQMSLIWWLARIKTYDRSSSAPRVLVRDAMEFRTMFISEFK